MRLLLAALLFSATASAATTSENAAKYQALRSRLSTDFIVVGDAPGMSQPADERIEPQGIIRWSDSTIGLGWYIGALATEHHILSHPEQFPGAPGTLATTADELYYALRAMERLDLVADASFPPPCTQEPKLNGFFLRDDVPAGFFSNFPPMTAMTSDFIDPELTNKEMSQDQVYHVLLGLALVKALVPKQTFVKARDLNAWAAEQGKRIIEHVSSHNWVIKNPACADRDVNRGPLASGFSHGTRLAAGFFTDGAWLPPVDDALAGIWEISSQPTAPQYIKADNLHMAMSVAAVGNGWGAATAENLATLSEKEDWPAYPLAHRVIHGLDAGWCTAGAKVSQRARAMLDELPAGAEPKSPLPGGPAPHGFTVWNRFIRGKSQHYVGSPNSEGIRYNGVDYLLLHNLYAIATPATWEGGNGPGIPDCPPDVPDAGTGGAGKAAASSDDSGCGCRVSPTRTGSFAWLGLTLALAARRRSRRDAGPNIQHRQ